MVVLARYGGLPYSPPSTEDKSIPDPSCDASRDASCDAPMTPQLPITPHSQDPKNKQRVLPDAKMR